MKRSKFNLSHRHHTTMEMGKLVPFFMRDCLPGDIHRISSQAIFRAIPLLAPMMSKVEFLTQFYFVPYRLLWSNWTEFITGGEDGLASPQFPVIKAPADSGFSVNSVADYMGFPINQPEIEVSALPFRAMNKIWNDHYKIDDIETDIEYSIDDGLDTTTPTDLLSVHWARDTFTRAKPFTQRGSQVSVPVIPAVVEGSAYPVYAPIVTIDEITSTEPVGSTKIASLKINVNGDISGFTPVANFSPSLTSGYVDIQVMPINGGRASTTACTSVTTGPVYYAKVSINYGNVVSYSDSPVFQASVSNFSCDTASCFRGSSIAKQYSTYCTNLNSISFSFVQVSMSEKVELGSKGAINIRDLRIASALQRFQEKSLKYGAEYEDYCRMEFGVRPRDSRLNKSEYIGGSSGVLQISEILQTSASTDTSPLGNMAGSGIGSMRQKRIKYFCPEHGIIIGFASIRPETIYTQGIKRDWLKRTRFDFFTREFANIGAQEIFQQELFATKDNKDTIFGYNLNGNYNEYRHDESRVSGNFRTDLSFWHLGRIFNSAPVLNSSFMKMVPRKDIFAVTDESLPPFLVMFQNNNIAYRPIPKRAKNILK